MPHINCVGEITCADVFFPYLLLMDAGHEQLWLFDVVHTCEPLSLHVKWLYDIVGRPTFDFNDIKPSPHAVLLS